MLSASTSVQTVNCPQNAQGSFVKLEKPASGPLTLCEVKIYGPKAAQEEQETLLTQQRRLLGSTNGEDANPDWAKRLLTGHMLLKALLNEASVP
jgi:hypothetical protein